MEEAYFKRRTTGGIPSPQDLNNSTIEVYSPRLESRGHCPPTVEASFDG